MLQVMKLHMKTNTWSAYGLVSLGIKYFPLKNKYKNHISIFLYSGRQNLNSTERRRKKIQETSRKNLYMMKLSCICNKKKNVRKIYLNDAFHNLDLAV